MFSKTFHCFRFNQGEFVQRKSECLFGNLKVVLIQTQQTRVSYPILSDNGPMLIWRFAVIALCTFAMILSIDGYCSPRIFDSTSTNLEKAE